MAITRLEGGLTPADGSDPRTFPTIWNATSDLVEGIEGDLGTLTGRVDNLDTDDVPEGLGNLYFTDARAEASADQQIAAATTDDLSEGATNLYFTDARVDGVIAASDTDDLSEGVTNLYFTDGRADARADVRIAASTTDDLTEGISNLYFTDARAEASADQQIAAATTDNLSEGVTNLYFTNQRAADAAPVQSVNAATGTVVLDAGDVGALPATAELDDLADVDTTGVTNGQLIAYNAANDKWELASAAGIVVSDITALNLTWGDF